MDYTKRKKFIAFINVDKNKNKYWIDHGFPWSEECPSLFPFETEEERKLAIEIGESISTWPEINDIEGKVITISQEIIPIMKKKDNAAIVEKYEKLNEEKKRKQFEKNFNKSKKTVEVDSDVSASSEDSTLLEISGINIPLSEETAISIPKPKVEKNKPGQKHLPLDTEKVNDSIPTKPAKEKKETTVKTKDISPAILLPKTPISSSSLAKNIQVPNTKLNENERKNSPKLAEVGEVKPKLSLPRSPLEKKSPIKEKETKVEPAPSEPKKKSGLSRIMKGK